MGRQRLIVENEPSKLARAIHMNVTDMIDEARRGGGTGISIQKISATMDDVTEEPIILHEARLIRDDGNYRPVRTFRRITADAAGAAVVERRSQESLFPINDRIDMFGPLSDIPTKNTILCLDRNAADLVSSIESVDTISSDFEAIEGKEADREDVDRAGEVFKLRGRIYDLRQDLLAKQNEIVSFHRELYGLSQEQFEDKLLHPDDENNAVPGYQVREYLTILDDIRELQDEIRAISGAVFEDTQQQLGLDVDVMPQFDFTRREGWSFGY